MSPIVVLPISRPDLHLGIKWLRWAIALRHHDVLYNYRLIVVPAASVLADEVDRIREECVKTVGFYVFQQREAYERPELGYGAAANALFKEALELAEKLFPGAAMLWCEADTVATRPTWFDEIAAEYESCGRPFLGAFHSVGPIPHCSGNAVYPANWRELSPCLAGLPGPKPEQGWDSACAFEVVPQMAVARTIQQEWITPPFSEFNIDRILKKETALFHRSKDGTMIDVLAKRLKIPPIPLDAPVCAPTSTMATLEEAVAAGPRPPVVTIFIVTHAKDIPFLKYCLKSIKLYATGFKETILLVPAHEIREFDWVKRKDVNVKAFEQPEGKGFLAHMIQKCRADEWCPDADYVLHLDADVLFFRKATPADFIKDHQCLCLRESYAGITNPHRHTWRQNVRNATGLFPDHDYMLRHGTVHPCSVYRTTRELVESHTGKRFDEFVLDGRNEFPQSFAEFPTLGAVGRHLFACSYRYMEYDKAADVALTGQEAGSFQYVYKRDIDVLTEFWGHGGIDRYKSDCEAIINGRICAYWVK